MSKEDQDNIELLSQDNELRQYIKPHFIFSKFTCFLELICNLFIFATLIIILVLDSTMTLPIYFTLLSFVLLVLSSFLGLISCIQFIIALFRQKDQNVSMIFKLFSFAFYLSIFKIQDSIFNVFIDREQLSHYQQSSLIQYALSQWNYQLICTIVNKVAGVILVSLILQMYHILVIYWQNQLDEKEQNISNVMKFFNGCILINFSIIIILYNFMKGFDRVELFQTVLFNPPTQYIYQIRHLMIYCLVASVIIFFIMLSNLVRKKGFYIFVAVIIFINLLFNATYTGELYKRFQQDYNYLQDNCPLKNYNQDFVFKFTGCVKYGGSCDSEVEIWENQQGDYACLNMKCCPFLVDTLMSPLNSIFEAMLYLTCFFVAVFYLFQIMFCLFNLSAKTQHALNYKVSAGWVSIFFSLLLIGANVALFIFKVGNIMTPEFHK